MSKFDIKKAWPVAVVAAGVAASAQAGVTSIPASGVYTSGLLGGAYFLSVTAGYIYSPSSAPNTTNTVLPTVSSTSGVLVVDLKGTGTTPTWGFAIATAPVTGTAATTFVNTMVSAVAGTTSSCQVQYMIAQDLTSMAITIASATVSSVTLNSGKAATSSDSTTCGATFQGRTGITMTNGGQPLTNTVTYTHIF